MDIDATDTQAHESVSVDKEEKLIRSNGGSTGKCLQEIQDFVSVFEITTGQFSNDKRMAGDFGIKKQSLELLVTCA